MSRFTPIENPLQQKIDACFKKLSSLEGLNPQITFLLTGLKAQFDCLHTQKDQIALLMKKVDQVHGSGAAQKEIEAERIRGHRLTMKDTIAVLLSKLAFESAPAAKVTAPSKVVTAAPKTVEPNVLNSSHLKPAAAPTPQSDRARLAHAFDAQIDNRQKRPEPTKQTIAAKPRLPRLGQIFNAQIEKKR